MPKKAKYPLKKIEKAMNAQNVLTPSVRVACEAIGENYNAFIRWAKNNRYKFTNGHFEQFKKESEG
jgi:hypothetical protein